MKMFYTEIAGINKTQILCCIFSYIKNCWVCLVTFFIGGLWTNLMHHSKFNPSLFPLYADILQLFSWYIIIIIIIIFMNCSWVIKRWQCLLYMSANMKMVRTNMKMVNTKFKTGGLHEKHVVATWNLGNHLSICL